MWYWPGLTPQPVITCQWLWTMLCKASPTWCGVVICTMPPLCTGCCKPCLDCRNQFTIIISWFWMRTGVNCRNQTETKACATFKKQALNPRNWNSCSHPASARAALSEQAQGLRPVTGTFQSDVSTRASTSDTMISATNRQSLSSKVSGTRISQVRDRTSRVCGKASGSPR